MTGEAQVRLTRSASWRFAEGIEQLPLVALYVRDAMGLGVPPGELVPPRLDAVLPDRSGLLDAGQSAAAGAQWLDWWRAVLARDIRMHRGTPEGVERSPWMEQLPHVATALFDPSDFASRTDRPALRAALRASFPEALRWADQLRRTLLEPPQGSPTTFDYQLVRAVAEQTIRYYRVSPDAVTACAVVLPVEGCWWYRYEPGAIVCSVPAAADPVVARAVLTDAFASGLTV